MTEIEILHRLKQQVEGAIVAAGIDAIRHVSDSEQKKYLPENFDLIVGDFAIHVLTPYEKVWPKPPKIEAVDITENLIHD